MVVYIRTSIATNSPTATLLVSPNNVRTNLYENNLTVARVNGRNSALSDALLRRPQYAAGGWVWIYNTAATIRQGLRKGADNKVLEEKLSLNFTGPFKIIAVGPAPAADTPDGRPLGDKLLYLDLPSNLSGPAAKPRVTVARCKPCANPYDAAAHRCRGYLHCRPCGRNRRRRAPCTASAGTLGPRATNHSDLCRTPYTAAAHCYRGYLPCRPCGHNRRRRAPCTAPAGTFGPRATNHSDLCRTPYTAAAHCYRGYLPYRPCGRNRRRRAPCTAPAGTLGPRATNHSDLCRTPYTAAAHCYCGYLRCRPSGRFHCRPCGRLRRRRAPCTAPAAKPGPRAMYLGGFHRPHCAATAAKPGPRAMYLLRQRLGPRAMYLGGFHRPHCATTAAELGPRAMYLGGFHRPHCVAAAANASPCHGQSRDLYRPCCTAAPGSGHLAFPRPLRLLVPSNPRSP